MAETNRPLPYEQWTIDELKSGLSAIRNLQFDPGFRMVLADTIAMHERAQTTLMMATEPHVMFRLQGEMQATYRFIGTAVDIEEHLAGILVDAEHQQEIERKQRTRRRNNREQ